MFWNITQKGTRFVLPKYLSDKMSNNKIDFKLFKTSGPVGVILFVLSILFFYIFSYFGGSSLTSVQKYERLMQLDYLEKNQPTVSFVHADIFSEENDTFNFFRTKQSLYYGYSIKGSSYVVCGKEHSIDFASEIKGSCFENTHLVTVNAFSDTNTMECIPLPLYKELGRNEISNVNKDIYLSGTYISLDLADQLIECESNDINSYDDFFDTSNPVVITLSYEEEEYKLVIKNIFLTRYIDNCEAWSHEDYSKYTQKYNTYNSYFSIWNKYSFFVSDLRIFSKYGCHLSADIHNNYANMRNYIERIFGGDFSINNCTLDIFLESKDNGYFNANNQLRLDYFYSKRSGVKAETIIFIVLSFVFGVIFMWTGACVFNAIPKQRKQIGRIAYLLLISFGSFAVYQFLSYYLCYFIFDHLYYLFATNIFGNILTLTVCSLLLLLNIVHLKKENAYE